MNDPVQQWLAGRASPPGTLACALRSHDGKIVSRSVDEAFPATAIENILASFEALAAAGAVEGNAPQWSTWSFENGQVRLVERPDGWRFALVIRNELTAMSALDSVSQDFLSMSFGG